MPRLISLIMRTARIFYSRLVFYVNCVVESDFYDVLVLLFVLTAMLGAVLLGIACLSSGVAKWILNLAAW